MTRMKNWISLVTRRKGVRSEGDELTEKLSDTTNESNSSLRTKKSEFETSFTVHGLARIFTGSRTESIFWLCTVLIGIVLCSYVIHGLIKKFLEYSIYTDIRSVVTTKNILPAVTICEYNSMISNYFAYCGKNRRHHNTADMERPCEVMGERPSVLPKARNNISEQSFQWSNGIFNVKQCVTWGGKSCGGDQYFKSLPNHNHFCFTLNHGNNLYDSYSHIYIQFEVNRTMLGNSPFIIAVLHDPRITELDMTNRVVLEPSVTYELKIDKSMTKRLPLPFPSNCTNRKGQDIFPGKYSRRNCLESIAYINMYKECGDILDYHKKYIPQHIQKKYKKNKTLDEIFQCFAQSSGKEIKPDVAECQFPCEELEYSTTATFYGQKDEENQIYRFHLQYQKVDSYTVMEEKQLYTWDQVAGEIGGLAGLMIGASFISIIEILCYCVLCALQKIGRVARNRTKTVDKELDEKHDDDYDYYNANEENTA